MINVKHRTFYTLHEMYMKCQQLLLNDLNNYRSKVQILNAYMGISMNKTNVNRVCERSHTFLVQQTRLNGCTVLCYCTVLHDRLRLGLLFRSSSQLRGAVWLQDLVGDQILWVGL